MAILDAIIHSLDDDVSGPEHEPGSSLARDKIVVMGRLKAENTDWVGERLPLYVFCSFAVVCYG